MVLLSIGLGRGLIAVVIEEFGLGTALLYRRIQSVRRANERLLFSLLIAWIRTGVTARASALEIRRIYFDQRNLAVFIHNEFYKGIVSQIFDSCAYFCDRKNDHTPLLYLKLRETLDRHLNYFRLGRHHRRASCLAVDQAP